MVIEIIDYSSEEDKPEKVIVDDIKEISDDDLFRLAGGGDHEAILELVRRNPELGDPEAEDAE